MTDTPLTNPTMGALMDGFLATCEAAYQRDPVAFEAWLDAGMPTGEDHK